MEEQFFGRKMKLGLHKMYKGRSIGTRHMYINVYSGVKKHAKWINEIIWKIFRERWGENIHISFVNALFLFPCLSSLLPTIKHYTKYYSTSYLSKKRARLYISRKFYYENNESFTIIQTLYRTVTTMRTWALKRLIV